MTRRGDDDESGGGWSDPGPRPRHAEGAPDPSHPFRTDESDRYQRVDVVGAGGMGTVYVSQDRRLGREVALKEVTRAVADPGLARRLAREAWITAALEHPGIVPVYDAGESADGRLFYTMRLIRGRSLAAALAASPSLPGRLALLRHYLAVCEAVAFAHSRGVVHRDLKPANVMVGAFGETQVVDWGLAGFVDAQAAQALAPPGGRGVADAEPVAPNDDTGLLGTPAYMSPEQALGVRVDRRADVWSLGTILYELITGRRPIEGDSPSSIMSARRDGRVDLSPLRQAGAPAALAAIVEKALAADPAARYPDAAALAADVASFVDGRRVAAHDYTALELLGRLVRVWRVPLVVAALGLVIAAVVFTLTWRRVLAERGRAVDAEQATRQSLDEARELLAASLESRAVSARASGERAEAEVIAALALELAESPEARGVLAAAYAGARPLGAEVVHLPGCERVVPSIGDTALCVDRGELAAFDVAPARQRWRRAMVVLGATMLSERWVVAVSAGGEALLLDAVDGRELARFGDLRILGGVRADATSARFAGTDGHELVVVDAEARSAVPTGRVCGDAVVATHALAASTLLVVCGDGRVVVLDPAATAPAVGPGAAPGARAAPRAFTVPFGRTAKPAYMAALSGDERRAIIGSVDGDVAVVELATGQTSPLLRVADGPPGALLFVGERVLVQSERGAAAIWDIDAGVELLRLPLAASRRVVAAGDVVVGGGAALWRWKLPGTLAPWRVTAPAGLAGAAASPDGRWLAGARGDGHVSVWSRADGHVVADLEVIDAVIKRVAFSPDGTRLAVALSHIEGSAVFDTSTWRRVAHDGAARGTRRIFYLATGQLVAVHYGPGVFVWERDGTRRAVAGPVADDASLSGDGRQLFVLAADGGVWRLGVNGFTQVLTEEGARSIAASHDGQRLALGHEDRVEVVDLETGTHRRFTAETGDLLDVAISPDGRWLVAATRAGSIDVWSLASGAYVAALRGHAERIAELAFGPGGELLSASWDGTLHAWNLDVLTRDAADLVQHAERDWGQDLTTALAGRRRPGVR